MSNTRRFELLFITILFVGCKSKEQINVKNIVPQVKSKSTDTSVQQTFREWDGIRLWEMRTVVVIERPYKEGEWYGSRSVMLTRQNNGSYRTFEPQFDTTVIGGFDSLKAIIPKFRSMANEKLTDLRKQKLINDSLNHVYELHQKYAADTLNMLSQLSNNVNNAQ